jgi:hypothetical protein
MAQDPNARALAVLRIGVGLFFLIFAQYKIVSTQFTLHGGFQFCTQAANRNTVTPSAPRALPSYQTPVLAVVLPYEFKQSAFAVRTVYL